MNTLSNLWESALSTTAFRAAAIVVAVFTLAAALIMWFVSVQTNRVMTRQVLVSLSAEAKLLRAEGMGSGLPGLHRAVALRSRIGGSGLYILADLNGTRLAGNLTVIPEALRDGGDGEGGVFRYTPLGVGGDSAVAGGASSRLAVGILVLFPGAVVVVARDVEDQRALSHRILLVSLLGFGVLGVGGLAAGIFVSRLVLSRVNAITESSRAIMAGDLSERLPRSGSGDEFDRLSENLNVMLSRIEQLMHGLREVSDNIAHDLKTPLNRLRNRAEEALRDPRGEQAQRQGLERTIEAADELISTFNALLLIARLEAGAVEETLSDVDVVDVVSDVAELYEPVAMDAGMRLMVDGARGDATTIAVNRQLVGQSVANLIDNAIKYTKVARRQGALATAGAGAGDGGAHDSLSGGGVGLRGKDISVRVFAVGDNVEISVSDRGPGIALEDRQRVLQRFVRLERSRTAPGTGLGLSLVAAVARLHGGNVRLEDNEPGLRVVVQLPRRGVSA